MVARTAPPHLRPYVLGWASHRVSATAPPPSRMLPLNAATLIIDCTGLPAVLTGPRSVASPAGEVGWYDGVAVGLTPAGMSALLGTPMRELADTAVRLEGARAKELAERLAAAPSWQGRFAVLEETLTAWARPADDDALIMYAWRRLQAPAEGLTVTSLAAELGVSRRYLELGFRRVVGLSPKTVARVARFQRAMEVLRRPGATLSAAVACGYADQSHLSREVRAMTALTPKQLFALVQDVDRLSA
ncbi:helix-turn-helix transcriptional regulator [Nonomuraea sp. NPDC049419]|uniref:helix-turn-helix transcriptional regulator n=1 Tax=Nonomuraea sp. NPDC049419 TaxID=3155772 RepID=UPI003449E4B1